jgi:transcriptional regulator with XRE-family HTH domain
MVGARMPRVHDLPGHDGTAATAYHGGMNAPESLPARRLSVGDHVRQWRQLRRLSQLDLALEADISPRHLSCVETGKANPSRELVLRLCERLAVPLRERNAWLVAAGYAPMYREHAWDDPSMQAARRAVQHLLDAHAPWPALAFDRHWNLVLANGMVAPLLDGVDAALLAARPNLLRIALHPRGLAPRIANLDQWRAHLFERLQRQIRDTGDGTLTALLAEVRAYPAPPALGAPTATPYAHPDVLMPLLLDTPAGRLHLISTTTVFGSPLDITLQELALETFFPGDEASANALRRMAGTH